jgi:hypothetical protein
MSAVNFVGKTVLLTVVILNGACSTTQSAIPQEDLQQAALARWNGCIERHTGNNDKLAIDLHKVVSTRCEGHQRDVLATFPIHLENQVNSLLSKRSDNITTERFLRSSNLATWKIPESTHVDSLKPRSSSPLAKDL